MSRLLRAIVTAASGAALLAAVGVSPTVSSRAASASVPSNGVTVSSEVHHDTSPPLRDMQDTHTQGVAHPANRAAGGTNAPSTQATSSADTSGFSATPRIPSTSVNFDGIGANGSAPPDNDGAVGATQFVELVNSQFEVFNKSGGVVLGAQATNTLWSGFGGGCQSNNDGDGTVLWDTMAQRWFIQQFSVTTTPYLDCLAVSTTSDATGSWNRYSFQYANFPDYPKTGVWPDAYYASFNLFNSTGTIGLGTDVCAYNRSAMLSGAAATQQCFMATSSGEHTLLPATLDGTSQPPAGEPEWFVGLAPSAANALGYFKFHVDFATPANSSLSSEADIAVAPFTQACASACVPQSGTSQQLDALGDRVMFRLDYRNFGDHEAMVVNHSIISSSPTIGVRWYELRPSGTSLSLFQQGTVAPDSNYRWMGSIAMDQSNDMALGYSVSSSSLHPGIRYTGRLANDAAGTMAQGESTIITGAGSQSGQSLSRWGDYSEMTVDPVDGCTFWYVNEYEATTGAFNWSTRIGAFKFPSCGGTVTNDFSLAATNATATQGSSGSSTVSTTLISGSTQSVTLSASGLPAGASAGFSPNPINSGASSTLTITTSPSTPTGTSTVTVTGTGTSATHSTTLTLTVNPAGGGGGITNGGFETGTFAGWTTSGAATSIITTTPQAGTYAARAGTTTPTNGDSNMSQTFTVPTGGTGIQFYYRMTCPDTITYDWATATLVDNTTATTTTPLARTCVTSSGWTVVNAAATAGHSYTLTLTSHDDNYSADPSYTDYDSVSITGGAVSNDFSISANPTSVSVVRGNSGTSTISTLVTSGSAQPVTLSASGLPSGATASFSPNPVTAGSSSVMTLSTATTAATGAYPVTVTGVEGTATHTTSVSLTVTAPADFTIAATNVTATQGSSGTGTVSTTITSGSAQSVTLSASGLPAGASAGFSPNPINSGASSTLTITTSPSTPTGTSTVTVTGTGTSATHSTTLTLTVNPAGGGGGITNGGFETGTFAGWTTSGAATSIITTTPQAGTYAARAGTTTPTNGDSNMSQTFTVPTGGTGIQFYYRMTCPDTITYDWATATLVDNTTATTTTPLARTCVTSSGWTVVNAAATAGHSYTLTLTSHDDNYSADPSYTDYDSVSITGGAASNDFSISANPTSVSVVRGNSGTSTISTLVTSGSAAPVTLSASGLPSGATALFSVNPVTAGNSSVMTLSTATTAATGTYPVTVTGVEGTATHTTSVSLTVTAPADFTIAATNVTATQGSSGTGTVSTTITSGSAQSVTLSASGLPAGASAGFNPNPINSGASSTLTITTSPSTPTGTSTVTVTGTGTPATHSTTLTLTVNPAGGGGGITNGGFETGTFAGWTTSGAATSIITTTPQAGTYAARAGATTPTNGDSNISQTFTVPSGGTGIQFYYRMTCPDTITYDWATATLVDNTTATTTTPLARTCVTSSGWTVVNAAATAGHSYTLTLTSHDDNYGADPSYTDFDSVSITSSAPPPALTQVSSDTFTDPNAEHATQVEPDTLSNGSTIVSAFQVGRFNNGGADDTGWATSTNGGTTWSRGLLPGLTTVGGGSPNLGWARVSDPSVAYDGKHGVWLISGLTIDAAANGRGVSVSRSTDGITWQNAINAISQTTHFYDKDWIACDSTPSSPSYGNCYIEFDDNSLGNSIRMLTSTDGGLTWSAARATADSAQGLGGQPIVQPNGTVVVPYLADGAGQIRSFTSTNGGTTWNSSVLISGETTHAPAGGFRTSPLPTAEIDSAGTIYVAWQDCRFRSGCPANDIVMSTSANGTTWSAVARIPIDPTTSGVDHFVPGLGVDRSTAGASAHLGLYYYYYASASCSPCSLNVGFISSTNGGSAWSIAAQVAGPFALTTIAPTSQGPMVGDYISTSFVNGNASSVFAVGSGSGSPLNEAMYTVAGGLTARGGHNPVDTDTGGGGPPRPGPPSQQSPGTPNTGGGMTAF